MIEQLLNEQTLQELAVISHDFAHAQPFKHVLIDDFFAPEFCQSLLHQFPDFNNKDAIDENQMLGKKAVVETVPQIGPAYQQLDKLVQSTEFLQLMETITGIPNLIYDPYYIGGGTHNNLDGQELDPHVDFTHHPITSHHRRLNLIVYLNHHWQSEWGGAIEFHQNPRLSPEKDQITSVLPLFNRAVIFETHNHSWHGFSAIQLPAEQKHLSRKSFALYYYTDKRQTAIAPHSTIYVERHLADRYEAGYQLSAEDVNQLKSMLGRRDQHLERLYKSITAQTIEISRLKAELQGLKTLAAIPTKQAQAIDRQLDLLSYDENRLLIRILELENSASWKITAPIRKLRRWLKR